ncbi:PKD domain-containing protein [bacterium]|nr:PKD domain-containing protein [bacterium]
MRKLLNTSLLLAFILLSCLGLGACGAASDPDSRSTAPAGNPAPMADVDVAGGLPSWPSPGELPRHSSGGPEDYQRLVTADSYNFNLPYSKVSSGGGGGKTASSLGSSLLFSPAAPAGAQGLSGAAYCSYVFYDAKGYSGPSIVQYAWVSAPSDFGQAYIALSNFVTNRWDWFPMEADGSTEIGSWDPYAKDEVGARNAYMFVVLLGQEEAELDWVLQGGPAAFNLEISTDMMGDPALNVAPLSVEFDVSSAQIVGGSFAGFDWDFQNDGIWDVEDEQDGVETFSYVQPGEYDCLVRIRSVDGHEDYDLLSFTVVDPNNSLPTVVLIPDVYNGDAPLPVSIDASASVDNGQIINWEWDLDNDGVFERHGPGLNMVDHIFNRYGKNTVTLRVTDNDYAKASNSVDIELATGWRSTLLDTDIYLSGMPGLCVAGSGPAARACLLYSNYPSGDLFFSRAQDAMGSSWSAPLAPADNSAQLGECCDMVWNPDQQRLQIAFTKVENSTYKLLFANSSFPDGSGWDSPVEPEAGANLGYRFSLALSSTSRPMLGCVRNGSVSGLGELCFLQAGNNAGTAWNAAQTLSSAGDSGQFYSLELQDAASFPLLVFAHNNNEGQHFGCLRASSTDGSSWNGEQLLLDGKQGRASCQIVQGRPALALGGIGSSASLLYMRSSDSSGAGWPAAQELVAEGYGGAASMALIYGAPAVAFNSFNDGAVKFIQAMDSAGSSWFAPQVVDSTEYTSDYCALASCNNAPVIVYNTGSGKLYGAWYQN